ncbi:phosphate signaling complex protein PhoU [Paenibacillus aurantius]|uniref:Phosphate-specific transport system accessory protein PhoU n=1 Tax=Paenibacillus aurantius TaxID=2918900 RepID=A0AA96RBX1_9BACL|nr:phosphate signaling complex protein PhoU [Paenibacillus aurantius]WNQ09880.1 phosphate signaling complex protein PhoU [Paenibacillus aurantius]
MDTRPKYHQALNELQQQLLVMGELVERQIQSAVDSLKNLDEQKARDTVEKDDQIDDLMSRIEERCLRLIALQQPMASDLRIIGMTLKIAIDLERIADHAVDIAKVTIRMSGENLVKPLIDIPRMADLAMGMLRESLLSFTEKDVNRAASLAEKDDEVDKLYSTVLMDVTALMGTDLAANRQLTHLIMVANHLERVADHTTNIGEGVIFLVTGKRKDLNV